MRKQSIKAAAVLLLASMLLASIPAPSYAEEGTSVYISDLDLGIVVPSGFDIFTRENAADDYLFTKYGITHDQLLTMMEAQNSYLDAISVDNLSELTIIRFDSIFSDFDTMSDNSLIALGSVLKELFSSSDVIIEHDGVYSRSQVKFVKFAVRTETDGEIQTLMYTTSFGGNMISFTLQSYSGTEITSAQESTLKQFVDSAYLAQSHRRQVFKTLQNHLCIMMKKLRSNLLFQKIGKKKPFQKKDSILKQSL